MELYVFDKQFNMLGIIDNYTSLIWVREYYSIGTLELHTLIDENSLQLLQKGNIIVKPDDVEEAMYIDTIHMDYDNIETMIVRGFSIDNFLEDRMVWRTQTYSGTTEQVIRQFIDKNCINPVNGTNRVIPNLILGPLINLTETTTEVNSYGRLSEWTKELCLKYDIGWRIRFDRQNKKYVFELYKGKDSSLSQNVNPHMIFSAEYENIFNQSYMDSDTSLKNMALIAGAGEENERMITLINNEATGFNRKELFVDARDISDKDEDNNPIPPATYVKLLTERGNLKLAESTTTRTFESEISILSNLVYRKDFDLGHKVSVQNKRWGLVLSTRITSVEEVYENNTTNIRVNFGSVIPTLESILKKVK